MAKTNRPRRRMDRYFKNLQRNSYILSYNKKGSCTTKIKKWDVIRRLTKKLVSEDEPTGKVPKEPRSFDPGVQLLPRQDVMLYGTIPAMEQRVYSKCKNCTRVFNPRDILSHRSCSKSHTLHSSLLKKKVKSKSSNGKKTSSNGSASSNSTTSNSSVVATSSTSPVKDPLKDFEFKRPYTPPPIKAAAAAAAAPSMPQLKVSVTKIGISKAAKSTPVTTSTTTSTSTTSSDKSDRKVSSIFRVSISVHHSPKSPALPGHHSSKSSSGHSPRSPSSSSSSGPKSPSSSHHSPKSPSSSSHHRSKSPSSSALYNPRSPSKSSSSSHHGSSHHTSSHHSSKSSSKSTPMDTLPPSSSSSHHHHSSSSSSHGSSRHKKSSSSSSKRSSSTSSGSSSSSSSSAKILPKNYDPDIHCGVIEGNRRPCMRSITCSNHRLHLRKQVSGRSKDIHQLISERKAAKENDLKHTTPPCSYTSPNGEAKDILSPNTSFVPVVAQVVSTAVDSSVTNSFVPIMPRVSSLQTRLSTGSVLAKKPSSGESENESAKTLTSGYISRSKNIENTQDSVVGTVPVVIMPVSPVSVVSSVQLLKIGNNIISLESPQSATSPPSKKQVILPIPSNHTNGVKMYKSHPKPLILPNFGARKLGGAILLANPLLEDQRNDLLTTTDIDHRDRFMDRDGFILHADVSKMTDTAQYTGENGPSQHELIISLIDKYGF